MNEQCWKVLWTREVLKVDEYFADVHAGKIDEDLLGVRNHRQVRPDHKGVIIVNEGKNGRPRAAYATFVVTGEAAWVKDDHPEYLVNPETNTKKYRVRVRYDSVTTAGVPVKQIFSPHNSIMPADIACYNEMRTRIGAFREVHGPSPIGDVKERMRIEIAAVKSVKTFLNDHGYKVESVEAKNLGWDLEATKENKLFHVEVKGTKAPKICVELTHNEYDKSARPDYRLAVVRNALKKNPLCALYQRDEQIWRRVCGNDMKAPLRLENREKTSAIVKQSSLR